MHGILWHPMQPNTIQFRVGRTMGVQRSRLSRNQMESVPITDYPGGDILFFLDPFRLCSANSDSVFSPKYGSGIR